MHFAEQQINLLNQPSTGFRGSNKNGGYVCTHEHVMRGSHSTAAAAAASSNNRVAYSRGANPHVSFGGGWAISTSWCVYMCSLIRTSFATRGSFLGVGFSTKSTPERLLCFGVCMLPRHEREWRVESTSSCTQERTTMQSRERLQRPPKRLHTFRMTNG